MSIKVLDVVESSPLFVAWCAKAGVTPTARQYRAWRRGEGAAYLAAKREAGHNRRLRARLDEEKTRHSTIARRTGAEAHP